MVSALEGGLLNLYQTIKQNVSNTAAECYGVTIQHNGMARCPFHDDHTPSLYIADDHFHCCGCGAHGDVIDFTARLFGISGQSVARKLAVDFGIDPNLPPFSMEFEMRRDERRVERRCIEALKEREAVLLDWQRQYAPKLPEAEWDSRYVTACRELPHIQYAIDTLLLGSPTERQQMTDLLMADGRLFRTQEDT